MPAPRSSTGSKDFPEFAVRAEVIIGFTQPPISRSTFHELVNKNRIVPVEFLRGYYYLNASLKLLGLKPTRTLPSPPPSPEPEDIVRLAFSLIDQTLFPPPAWLLSVAGIEAKDADHARLIAKAHHDEVAACESTQAKLAYLQGVLDAEQIEGSERKA